MLIIQFYVPQIRHLKSYHFIVYSKYNLVNVDEIKSSLFTISVSYRYAECMPSDDDGMVVVRVMNWEQFASK